MDLGCSTETSDPPLPWTNPLLTAPRPSPCCCPNPKPCVPSSSTSPPPLFNLNVYLQPWRWVCVQCFYQNVKFWVGVYKTKLHIVLFHWMWLVPQEALSLFAVSWTAVQVECWRLLVFCFPSWCSTPQNFVVWPMLEAMDTTCQRSLLTKLIKKMI